MMAFCSIDAYHLETSISVEAKSYIFWLLGWRIRDIINPHQTKTPPRHYEHHHCSILGCQYYSIYSLHKWCYSSQIYYFILKIYGLVKCSVTREDVKRSNAWHLAWWVNFRKLHGSYLSTKEVEADRTGVWIVLCPQGDGKRDLREQWLTYMFQIILFVRYSADSENTAQ